MLDMFKYSNLPDTIPQRNLELLLLMNGTAWFQEIDGKYYVFRAGLGGVPNVYYEPTIAIVANPAVPRAKGGTIDEDGILILNDPLYKGVMFYLQHISDLLAECDISFKFAAVNTRIPVIIEAPNDKVKKEAEILLDKVFKGEQIGVIAGSIVDKINAYDYATSQYMVQHLIELKQYIIGTFYQNIGIKSAFNMKRESLSKSEIDLNDDILRPDVEQMLIQRKIAIDKINNKYGLNIKVELNSLWKDNEIGNVLAIDNERLLNEQIRSEIDGSDKENS